MNTIPKAWNSHADFPPRSIDRIANGQVFKVW